MTARDGCGRIRTESAHGVRGSRGSVDREGGGTVSPTPGGGYGVPPAPLEGASAR